MKIACGVWFVSLCVSGILANASASLQLTTEHLPPYNIISPDLKHVTGLVAEKVFEMMRRAGISYSIKPSGWNRAYMLAQTHVDTCVFSTTRLPEREAMFQWIGPLAEASWDMYARIDEPNGVHSLADIHGDLISVYRNDAVALFLKTRGYSLVESESNEASLQTLLAGRADYWAQSSPTALRMIDAASANGKVRSMFTFAHFGVYLACNPGVSAEIIEKLRAAQKQMEQDGTMQRIDGRYLRSTTH